MAKPIIQAFTEIDENAASTPFTVSLPTGTIAGDLLLAIMSKDDDVAVVSNSGMTEAFGGGIYGYDSSSYAFWKIALASDITTGSMSFSGDSSEEYIGRMYRIDGHNPDNPVFAVSAHNDGASTTPTALTLTTKVDNLVFAWAAMDDWDDPYSVTTTGWTSIFNTGNAGDDVGIIIATRDANTSGATGSVVFSTPTSEGWSAGQISINGSFPPITILNTPADTATGQSLTPSFEFTGTDAQNEDVEYNVQLDTVDTFDSTLGPALVKYIDVPMTATNLTTPTITLNIWAGDGIFSTFIATASIQSSTLPNDFSTSNRFTFETPFPIIAGVSYTTEFVPIGGGTSLFYIPNADSTDQYDGGILWRYLNSVWSTWTTDLFMEMFDESEASLINIGISSIGHYQFGVTNNISRLGQSFTGLTGDTYTALLDKKSLTGDATFTNRTDGTDTHPFDSGDLAGYEIQTADTLDVSTTYYWRARGLDPLGTNTYGIWSDARSFTTGAGNSPTVVLNTPADTATGQSVTPTLEFTGTDGESDDVEYQVQVNTTDDFSESTGWQEIGNGLTGLGTSYPGMTQLNSNTVVFLNSSVDQLVTLEFDGTDWTQVGNGLSITSLGQPRIATLTSTRIAFTDEGIDTITTYDWDGTDWTKVGNSFSLGNVGTTAITGLTSSSVAFTDFTTSNLSTYSFDGTNWTLTGNHLSLSSIGAPALATLSATRVVVNGSNVDTLTTYDWDGTDWTKVGNSLSAGSVYPGLAALSSSRVAFVNMSADTLSTYDFDGTDWTQVGDILTITDLSYHAIAALSSERVALYDYSSGAIKTYDYGLIVPLIDKVSETDAGFANVDTPADTHPFNSGDLADYDIQTGAATALLDSYSETNGGTGSTISDTDNVMGGQSFLGDGKTISSFKASLAGTDSPSNDFVVRVYAHTGTFGTDGLPTGSILATSDSVSATTLTTHPTFGLIEFTFSGDNRITLEDGTPYFIMVEYENADTGYILFNTDNTSPTHEGNFAHQWGGTWYLDSGFDGCFYVYTEVADDTLDEATTYYWRARAIDPSGTNTYGEWATTKSFTTEGGSDTTTKTIDGVSRIKKTVDKTQTGVSEILVTSTTTKNQDGLSRITTTEDKTITGLSNVIVVEQTSKTQTGIARIDATTTQIQYANSRIQTTVDKTIDGVARIAFQTTKDIDGLARIETTVEKTIEGLSRIALQTTQDQDGLARIETTEDKTIAGVSNIIVTEQASKTQTGVARVEATVDEIQYGTARIEKTVTKTITGQSRINIVTTQDQDGVARVTSSLTETIDGTSRIETTVDKTIDGLSRIKTQETKDQDGLARITTETTKTITGLAKIVVTGSSSQSITGKSNIKATTTQIQYGNARIETTEDKVIDGVARVGLVSTNTQNGTSLIAAAYPYNDDFNDNSLNNGKWVESTNAGSLVVEQNQRLEVASSASISGFVRSLLKHSPQNKEVLTKVVNHTTDGGLKYCPTLVTSHQWDVYSEANWYNFQLIAGGAVRASKKIAGVTSTLDTSGALTAPYWIRIRTDSTNIHFDYVDNQVSKPTVNQWTNLASEAWSIGTGITQENYVYVTAYNTPTTGEGHYDDFWLQADSGPATTTTTKTKDGVARIETTSDETITGLSKIVVTGSSSQTQTGTADIKAPTTENQFGTSRITTTEDKTIDGVSRIGLVTTKDQSGVARVEATESKDQSGVARIETTNSETQDGLARIKTTVDETQDGVSRIETIEVKDITGLAKVVVTGTSSQTITGKANVKSTTDRIQYGTARIETTVSETIDGLARIETTEDKTIDGIARVETTSSETQDGVARIQKTESSDIDGLARIGLVTTKPQEGLARIETTVTETITGLAKVVVTGSSSQTITGKANVKATTDKDQFGAARIETTESETTDGLARIGLVTSKSQDGLARVTTTSDKTITGLAKVVVTGTSSQTQTGVANIKTTTDQNQFGTARIETTVDETIDGVSRIKTTSSETQDGLARIETTSDEIITGVAEIAVSSTTSKTITGTASIHKTRDKHITGVAEIVIEEIAEKTITGVASISSTTYSTPEIIFLVDSGIPAKRLSNNKYIIL